MNLQVITGGNDKAKGKIDYESLYFNAYGNTLMKIMEFPENERLAHLDYLKRVIFYGVKYINNSKSVDNADYETVERRFRMIHALNMFLGLLTPNDLLQMFPPDKRYNGSKYQMKDYFYTMDKMREHGMDTPIGDDALKILWEYTNLDIELYVVESMCVLSKLRRMEGEKGLLEEFADQQGLTLTTYNMVTDSKDQQLLVNNSTGERTLVKKKRPRYLKVM